MRVARIVAALIFSSALIISFVIPAGAAAETTSLYCEQGVANYTSPGQQPLWIDYTPTVNDNDNVFTFSSVPNTITQDGIDYSAYYFAFICYPVDDSVSSLPLTFEQGYVYTFNFSVLSTRLLDPEQTTFSFGICQEGFTDAMPLSEVVYTIENVTLSQKRYHITATVNVDASFPLSSMPDPSDTYVYLQMGSDWTADFRLVASQMTQKKSVGEDAYYQASLDAIENLPNSEYQFTLNMMPDSQGEIELIKGDIDEITEELNLITSDLYDIIISVEQNEPLIYLPQMHVPFLDIDIRSVGGINKYVTSEGFFRPLSMIESMGTEEKPIDLTWLDVTLGFIRLTFLIAFVTVGIENMIRIEWWL